MKCQHKNCNNFGLTFKPFQEAGIDNETVIHSCLEHSRMRYKFLRDNGELVKEYKKWKEGCATPIPDYWRASTNKEDKASYARAYLYAFGKLEYAKDKLMEVIYNWINDNLSSAE